VAEEGGGASVGSVELASFLSKSSLSIFFVPTPMLTYSSSHSELLYQTGDEGLY
jgi:hypothetical protein